MAISNELSTQFAKVINTKQKDEGQTVRGTYKEINGIKYVQLDGSDILTPVKTTVDAETGDKVSVLIKDHDATIMGNISSPAARATVVENLSDTVDEQGNTIEQLDNTIIQQGNSIVQMNTTINQHTTTISQHDTTIRQQGDRITSIDNTVTAQGNTIDSLNNTVTQHGDTITSIGNTVTAQGNTLVQHDNRITQNENDITQQGNTISQYGDQITSIGNTVTQQGNTITSLNNTVTAQGNTISAHDTSINTANANINILNSGFNIVDGVLTGLSSIVVNDLKTNTLNTQYAKIDFANIGISAIQKLFTDSGIINNLVVQDQHITGELVGVTVHGDLINANTLKADKLVVKGSDGVYYKLNIDGMDHISVSEAAKFVVTTSEPTNWSDNYKDYYIISNNEYIHVTGAQAPTWTANTYYKLKSEYESGLDGTTIVAHTITADKISVTDLVAFGATIGGFDIDNNSIHSHTKTSINSDANGIYIGNDGQMYLGDQNNKIKYYKDNNNQWHLDISANSLKFSSHSKTIAEELDDLEQSIEVLKANIDTNVVIIPVNEINEPVENKTIEVGYSIDYLGTTQSNILPTIIYPDNSHTPPHGYTGITTDLTVDKKIKFTVATGTPIQNTDNKYTLKWSKTVDNTTYEVTRTIIVSTLSTEAEQNVIISDTAPSDTSALWYDSVNNQLKRYDEDDGWGVVNDYSDDITSISEDVSNLNTDVQNYVKNGYSDYGYTLDLTFQSGKDHTNNNAYYELINNVYTEIEHNARYDLTEDTEFEANKKYYEIVDGQVLLIPYNEQTQTYTLNNGTEYEVGDTIPTNTIWELSREWYELNDGTEYDVGDEIPANKIYEFYVFDGMQNQIITTQRTVQAQFQVTERDITQQIKTTTKYIDSNVKGKVYYTYDSTTQTYSEYDGDRTGNPHTLGLYEVVNGEYAATNDETFDNGLQGQIDDIVDYVKFDAETVVKNPITGATHTGVVTIGKSNMATKLRLAADVLFFDYNDSQVAYIAADGENTKLYIKDAEVTKSINVAKSLSIGNFGWTVDTTDGSVTFGKVK